MKCKCCNKSHCAKKIQLKLVSIIVFYYRQVLLASPAKPTQTQSNQSIHPSINCSTIKHLLQIKYKQLIVSLISEL